MNHIWQTTAGSHPLSVGVGEGLPPEVGEPTLAEAKAEILKLADRVKDLEAGAAIKNELSPDVDWLRGRVAALQEEKRRLRSDLATYRSMVSARPSHSSRADGD